jgi:hypothetical protein
MFGVNDDRLTLPVADVAQQGFSPAGGVEPAKDVAAQSSRGDVDQHVGRVAQQRADLLRSDGVQDVLYDSRGPPGLGDVLTPTLLRRTIFHSHTIVGGTRCE